jgi:hypothetical protein
MVATQYNEMLDLTGLLFDLRQAPGDVSQRDCEVADVGQTQSGWIDPVQRMIAVYQHPACLPNR